MGFLRERVQGMIELIEQRRYPLKFLRIEPNSPFNELMYAHLQHNSIFLFASTGTGIFNTWKDFIPNLGNIPGIMTVGLSTP